MMPAAVMTAPMLATMFSEGHTMLASFLGLPHTLFFVMLSHRLILQSLFGGSLLAFECPSHAIAPTYRLTLGQAWGSWNRHSVRSWFGLGVPGTQLLSFPHLEYRTYPRCRGLGPQNQPLLRPGPFLLHTTPLSYRSGGVQQMERDPSYPHRMNRGGIEGGMSRGTLLRIAS